MSLSETKKVVDSFLSDEQPEALAIKGDWGVGKTYFWKKEVEPSLSEKTHPSYRKYSYVSLFGIDSLDGLKLAVFRHTVDAKSAEFSGKPLSLDERIAKWAMACWRLATSFFLWVLSILHITISKRLPFVLVRNHVVCLDDMERMSDLLKIQDVMGFVSLLKEQKNCKVILIFNEEQLQKTDHVKDYDLLREKVIDTKIDFSPTAEEATGWAFDSKGDVSADHRACLIECATELDIRNIRILKKIQRCALAVLPLLEGFEKEVSTQAISTLTLLTWSYYSHSHDEESVPSFSHIKGYSFLDNSLDDAEQQKRPYEKGWNATLRQYGFTHTDDFVLALADVVEQGYADKENLLHKAESVHKALVERKARNSFYAAAGLFHDSFDNNEEELLCALSENLIKHAWYIPASEMDQILFGWFKKLGHGAWAHDLLSQYCDLNKHKEGFFDIESDTPLHEFSPEVQAKFKQMHEPTQKVESLEDVLARIAGKKHWSGSDEQILAQATPDDFYKVFKKQKGENLSNYVGTCLEFGRVRGASEQQIRITNNAKSALVKIGEENRLNALRVHEFGIDVSKEAKSGADGA